MKFATGLCGPHRWLTSSYTVPIKSVRSFIINAVDIKSVSILMMDASNAAANISPSKPLPRALKQSRIQARLPRRPRHLCNSSIGQHLRRRKISGPYP
ncbi:hypothetical protein JG687_00017045 [Phytophthora cactorum]|uniref:Uncharacterized protein n=1 Tax=Phytophthora cactorum TaxID=29920 RepID=A0A8T1TUA0_9STRA|nr:hypothetical protein GQ600_27043 [Phytophthora cactorum]KAG6945863.1 hypothetical protein JG687_00017045 [Phytophthora cactorum]